MEGGSSNDHTVDSSVSSEDAVNLDLPPTPRPTKVPRYHSKNKGKAKVTGSSHDPELEAVAIAGSKPSTALSGAGLRSDGTDQAVGGSMEVDDRDDVVREITVFCGSGNLGEGTELYVMQHVLRTAWRPYELNKRCEETLSSTVVSSGNQYAVGFLEKNKLHLNPVHAILQLRPSFASDVPPKRKFASTKAGMPWVLLQYHPIDSSISNQIKHRMAAEGVGNVQFMMKPSDYLDFLSSGNLADKKVSGVASMRVLHRKPLEERLKKWFCKINQVNSFDALKHLAFGYSEDALLKLLPSYATLVRGLWVCKSSLLYSGAEAIKRDYILLLFNRMDTIQYHKLRAINLNPSVLKSMMDALAYDRKLLGDWKFKHSTDLSFIKHYPNIVEEQGNAWLDHEKSILDSLRKVEKKFSILMSESLASDIVKPTTAHKEESPFTNRDRDAFESLAGQSMLSETHEHLLRALLEIFNDKRVHSLVSIVRGLQEIALYKSSRPKEDPKTTLLVIAVANAVSAPREELCSVIDQVAVYIHGAYVLKSAANPALDPLRNVVINLFQGKEPNAKLKKQEIKQAAQLSLKRDISESEYNQVINELCVSRNGELALKSGD